MSELIVNKNENSEQLYLFARRLVDGENGKMLVETYQAVIESVNAAEAMQVFDRLLTEGYPFERVKANVGKIINVFFKSLNTKEWDRPGEGHFLHYLMLENRAMEKLIADVRPSIKALLNRGDLSKENPVEKLKEFVARTREYELHYLKKENILFPHLEKTFRQHRCLGLMWSFHDDYRKHLKALEAILQSDQPDTEALNTTLGRLFFGRNKLSFRWL